MSEKLYSSRMPASSVTSCQLLARSSIHWPPQTVGGVGGGWGGPLNTLMGIWSCPLCKPHGALGHQCPPSAARLLLVVNIHEQSCTQPSLLNSLLPGNPQLRDPAAAIQLSNWQFVSPVNQPHDASCDSYVKYSPY